MAVDAPRTSFPELRRGVLEYCVMALGRNEASYGFDIVRALSGAGCLLTGDGRRVLDAFTGDWRRFTDAVDGLLQPQEKGEPGGR
jgi:hypothetical protein